MSASPDTTSRDMSADEAHELIERIQNRLRDVAADVRRLRDERAWIALGYQSWVELCEAQLGARLGLTRDERDTVIVELCDAGLTTREIEAALSVGHGTVVRKRRGPNGPSDMRSPNAIDNPDVHAQVIGLLDQGAYRREIAAVTGLSSSHVGTIVARLGRRQGDRPRTYAPGRASAGAPRAPRRTRAPIALPEPKPAPEQPRHRRFGSLLDDLRDWQSRYDEERWAQRACHHVDSAREHDDVDWLNDLRMTTARLRDDLGRVLRVIDDDAFRDAQSRTRDGEPPVMDRPRLRSVTS